MRKNILTVFGLRDDQFMSEVVECLYRGLGMGEVKVDMSLHAEGAKQKVLGKGPCDLIITHVNVPIDGRNSDPEEKQGLRLLQELDEQGSHIPAVLFVPSKTTELLDQANELSFNCYVLDLVKYLENWQDELIKRSRIGLEHEVGHSRPQEEIKAVDVEISVAAESKPTEIWDVTFNVIGGGGDPIDCKPAVIQVESEKVEKLLEWSRRMEQLVKDPNPLWEDYFGDIGKELGDLLLKDPNFVERYSKLSGMAGGLEKFRIRFKVKRSAHPMIWEALAERGDKECDYWMLKAPIYRSVWTSGDVIVYQTPLFQDDLTRPHSCLVIQSDIGDNYVHSIEKQYDLLHNIEAEANFLEEFLSGKEAVGRVKKIPQRGEVCTRELVRKCLTEEGPWDIVHYAGHSYFGRYKGEGKDKATWTDHKEGLLFFPGEMEGEVTHVRSELFSKWLRDARTRFIYLSSCHSSEEDFLYELADRGIPSALGFRWDIKDNLAEEHTRIFYANMLKCLSLEYAFLRTRRDMHDAYKKQEIIWAAPVLILQTPYLPAGRRLS